MSNLFMEPLPSLLHAQHLAGLRRQMLLSLYEEKISFLVEGKNMKKYDYSVMTGYVKFVNKQNFKTT